MDNNNGCRMCVPYTHDGSELRNGRVLANVLFTDVDVHDAKSTIANMAKYMVIDSAEINAGFVTAASMANGAVGGMSAPRARYAPW